MSRNETTNERREGRPDGSGRFGMPCCPGGVAWPDSGGKQNMQACSCLTWFRRHRLAAYTCLIVAGLGFIALQVAWILGVVAFLRTL